MKTPADPKRGGRTWIETGVTRTVVMEKFWWWNGARWYLIEQEQKTDA